MPGAGSAAEGAGGAASSPVEGADGGFSVTVPDAGIRAARGSGEVCIVLCGWLGCKDRHLRRYRDFYTQKMGYTVVSFMMPPHLSVMPHTAGAQQLLNEVVEGVAKLQRESETGRWKLYFHTFSNTGWFCYGGMLDFMKRALSPAGVPLLLLCIQNETTSFKNRR